MKIQLMSDLHFEFGWKMLFPEQHKDTTLILAGDVDSNLMRLGHFIGRACAAYGRVIMVAGNHEFYGHSIELVYRYLKDMDAARENFHFLENDTFILPEEKIVIIGGTLWATPEWGVFNQINDHYQISYQGHRLTGNDITEFNIETKKYIKDCLALPIWKDWTKVVLTHFGPDQALMHPKWKEMNSLNTYFWSGDLEDQFQHADYWFFGHTHDPADMIIDGCRCICNPHGYVFGTQKEHNNYDDALILDI